MPGVQNLLVGVDPGLNLILHDERRQLVLKPVRGGVEGSGHGAQLHARKRRCVLNERAAADGLVNRLDAVRQIHVQHQRRADGVQVLEARGVAAVVVVVDHLTHLGHQLQKLQERNVVDDPRLQLLAVKARQRAQPPVRRDILGRERLAVVVLKLNRDLDKLARRQLVLFVGQRGEAGGALELGDRHWVLQLRRLLRLLDVIARVHKVLHLNGDLDDVEAHGEDVFGGGAVVARADVALEGGLQVAARVEKVPQVVVPHADALLHQVGLVPGQQALQLLALLPGLAVRGVHPGLVVGELRPQAAADLVHYLAVARSVLPLLQLRGGDAQGVEFQGCASRRLRDELQPVDLRVRGVVGNIRL
mmetsp:Transcript_35206/g.91471  ORF Transcript_35206/g.91471 Transcript_35206/m.91471 type:complete len:361 (+) Transcript_35206:242-1324(+)